MLLRFRPRSRTGAPPAGAGRPTGAARRAAVPVAVVALLTALGSTAAVVQADAGGGGRTLAVRDAGGALLASVPLDGRGFAVSYRNSVYESLAEERYDVLPDGRFRVVELAADEVAVLEEYYMAPAPARRAPAGDRRRWIVEPDAARPAVFQALSIAATDLGQRTLHVHGVEPVPLWRLVEDVPTVVLSIEENR